MLVKPVMYLFIDGGNIYLTERFDIHNIDDYIFEILEVVKNNKKIK